jgi:F-type H+-transporting ATPase subunit gamma
MSDTVANLRHKISSAADLKSVVRTMKALAASSIAQYENAVSALDDYYYTVQLGLLACFRQNQLTSYNTADKKNLHDGGIAAVVFGSDQGLVGQFNDVIADYTHKTLSALPGDKMVWAVGERVESRLTELNLAPAYVLNVPHTLSLITPLVGKILVEIENQRKKNAISQVYLIYNKSKSGAVYEPICQQLLPPNKAWQQDFIKQPWTSKALPEVIGGTVQSFPALMQEYVFVSLFRACAQSLTSENASRLAAMQRAEKNIAELVEDLNLSYHRLRQNAIDEELFDVIAGFEALVSHNNR